MEDFIDISKASEDSEKPENVNMFVTDYKEKEQNTFRIASLNVHSWVSPQATNNVGRIIETVKLNNIDVIGFQEVLDEEAEEKSTMMNRIASKLGMHVVYGGAYHPTFGNALLSKHPIVRSTSCKLYGPLETQNQFGPEVRGLVCTVLDTPLGHIGVYCTHLDHISEEVRKVQLQEIYNFLKKEQLDTIPHVILGDFNSLSYESDYPTEVWQSIVRIRQRNNWELPKSNIIKTMESNGYKDNWRLCKANTGIPTCWAKTRIDYIWSSHNWNFTPISCFRLYQDISDHYLIAVDFNKS